jgi:PAS domain S-box-containing protein
MRTIVLSYMVTDIICVWFVGVLWWQSRDRFAGIAFLVIDFIFQAAALILIIERGAIPDWMSMVFANALIVGGAILGFMGLERFVGKKGPQIHNCLLVSLFIFVHSYFSLVQPSQAVRNLNIAVALFLVCIQAVWLMWRRVEPGLRSLTFGVGLVNFLYCLVSVVRIVDFLISTHTESNYLQQGLFEVLVLLSYQMLFILLTCSLVLMVNKRLHLEIKDQEVKFAKAFDSSPYAISLTRMSDGQILEVNQGYINVTGYRKEEAIGRTILDLRLWVHEEERTAAVAKLLNFGRVDGLEFKFRTKTGEEMDGILYNEILTIHEEKFILSSINNITRRKQAEAALRKSEKEYREISMKLQEAYLRMSQKKDQIEARKYSENIIFLTADDGRICGFTEEAVVITKKSPSDMQDCNIQDILVFQDDQAFMDLIRKVRPRMSHLTTIRFKNQMEDGPIYEAKLMCIVVERKRFFYIVLH